MLIFKQINELAQESALLHNQRSVYASMNQPGIPPGAGEHKTPGVVSLCGETPFELSS